MCQAKCIHSQLNTNKQKSTHWNQPTLMFINLLTYQVSWAGLGGTNTSKWYASYSIRLWCDKAPSSHRTLYNIRSVGKSPIILSTQLSTPAVNFILLNLSPDVRKTSRANGKQILKWYKCCINRMWRCLSKFKMCLSVMFKILHSHRQQFWLTCLSNEV